MALNSLYPDGWFALGAAALKVSMLFLVQFSGILFYLCRFWNLLMKILVQARDVDKALDGFTRAVQLDPENGEAWNNIACLYVILFFSCSPLSLSFHSSLL